MIRLLLALLAPLAMLPAAARAEVCRFTGTTSHDGRLAVRAGATRAGDLLTIDVTVEFTVRAWMTDYRYLGQEITTWSVGEGRRPGLRTVAANQRSLADGSVKRQQWDVFTRDGTRLAAFRVGAKTLADFRQHHPGFVPHWPPAGFGQPWLTDFDRAGAARRPDLDLPATDVQTPLAFAFFWSRFLPPGGGLYSVVLPGFKHDKQLPLGFGAAMPGTGWSRWSTPLRHPALASGPDSLAAAWVSGSHDLLQLAFDVHTGWVSGDAILRTAGCEGVPVSPD